MNKLFYDKRFKPVLAAFCAFGWSLAYPLIKLGYSEFQIAADDLGSKVLFGGIRFFAAGIILTLFCIINNKKLKAESKTDYIWLAALGIVNIGLHYMFAYIGLGHNSGARSTILDSFGVFLLIAFSALFFKDDKFSSRKAVGCVLGFLAIVIATYEPGEAIFSGFSLKGDGMILLNALCAAFGGLITRVVSKKMNIFYATGLSMAIGGAMMIIFALIIGRNGSWNISLKGVIILAFLIMISVICFAVYNKLLAIYPISEISIFNALIPILGVMFSAIILGEDLKLRYICSVLIVSIGILLINMKKTAVK